MNDFGQVFAKLKSSQVFAKCTLQQKKIEVKGVLCIVLHTNKKAKKNNNNEKRHHAIIYRVGVWEHFSIIHTINVFDAYILLKKNTKNT